MKTGCHPESPFLFSIFPGYYFFSFDFFSVPLFCLKKKESCTLKKENECEMLWRLVLKTRVHSYVQLLSNNEVKVLLKLQ